MLGQKWLPVLMKLQRIVPVGYERGDSAESGVSATAIVLTEEHVGQDI